MKPRFFVAVLFVLLGALAACQPVMPPTPQPPVTKVTAKIFVQNSNEFGRVLVSARGNHFLIDSVPPLGHPAEGLNPMEAMLSALATCAIFVHETAASELEMDLTTAEALVQADWDVNGLRGEPVDPHVQEFRVHLTLQGPDAEEAEILESEFTSRCPIYNTLVRAAPIVITTNDEEIGGPIAEGLATSVISATLTNQPGRAVIYARSNRQIVDSIAPLGSPSEETNPMDLFLAAQATCGSLIMEKVALDSGLPLANVAATVEADLDPRGIRGADFSPHIQAMRVHWIMSGIDEAQAQGLVDQWLSRCPIYNTMIRATDITVTSEVVEGPIAMQ
jgi:uncharacterized OsmC-like protein